MVCLTGVLLSGTWAIGVLLGFTMLFVGMMRLTADSDVRKAVAAGSL